MAGGVEYKQLELRKLLKVTEPPNEGRNIMPRIRTLGQIIRTDWWEINKVLGNAFIPGFDFEKWQGEIIEAYEWAAENRSVFNKAGTGYIKDEGFIPLSALPPVVRKHHGELGYHMMAMDMGKEEDNNIPVGFCPGTPDFEEEVFSAGRRVYSIYNPGGFDKIPYEDISYDPEILSTTRMIDLGRRYLNGEGGFEGAGYILGYMFLNYCTGILKNSRLLK